MFFEGIVSRLAEIFDPQKLGNMFADGITNILVGLVVFAAFYIGWILIRSIFKPIIKSSGIDSTTLSFIEIVAKYTIILVGVVSSLNAAGIDTSALLASLGIAGLTIGFAARDALSNLISGILIFLDRPFVIGDLVELEGHYGKVDRITLRSTRIITSDGKMLAVPNAEVINKIVASYTNFPHLRLDISVTIGTGEDISEARKLLLFLVKGKPEYLEDPVPRVVVTALNDYNVELQLQAWIRNERDHVEMRSELREQVFAAFNKAGIEMPYQTIQLAPFSASFANTAG